MRQRFDVIVLGGGIMGCSAAFQLARRGLKVALLERDSIGAGSTGRSSAIIRQHYSNELTARMALYSLRVFQEFDDAVGGECGFRQTGFVILAAAQDRDGLEANIAMQQRLGIETALIEPEELRLLMPGLAVDDLALAAYEPQSGYADPYLTVNAYAAAARRLGVLFFQGTPARRLRFKRGRIRAVETAQGIFEAPRVLNCTGAWSAGLAKEAGVELPVAACRVQVLFFRRPAGHEAPHPVVADFINATYFRSETGRLTLLGLLDPAEARAVVNPDCYQTRVEDDFVLEAGGRLVARYPAMAESQSRGGYAALYAVTPDWHPIVDEVPAGSGFYTCSGFSGHGFKLGPAVGVMAAEMVTGASCPTFDPHLFRYDRFAAASPVSGRYAHSIVG